MSRTYLWIEYLAVFVVLPLAGAEAVRRELIGARVFPVLWALAAVCFIVLMLDRRFDRGAFVRVAGFRRHMRVILPRFVGAALALGVLVVALRPDALFSFPRRSPHWWALVMLLYPLFSVYPQGIVYRAFVFHRYRRLVGDGVGMVGLSTIAFTLCHAVFGNWVAIALTAAGGLMFAWTYWKSRSVTIAWLEHAMYGCFVFTIGLGQFLYAGRHQ